MTGLDQRVDEVRADEARSTGYEETHRIPFPQIGCGSFP